MKRIYKSKQTRAQLEQGILKNIKKIREGLSDRFIKKMDLAVEKNSFNDESKSQETVPYDQEKAKEVVEAFLKLKASAKN